ncbi:Cof-type HAD-IIB family hydrolase [Anaerorhabdus sp.]|uniref:Cof-type HAD-IIB family hydrolase n=1 Tax=Anaerorhabdus sp. TaxID=1872524 RepID=UPI002FCC0E0D
MTNIKLIASDLDHTLLNSKSGVNEFTKEVLNQAMDNEILFVPCSARTSNLIPTWFRENKKIKYLVTSNGAVVVDNITQEQLLVNAIHADDAIKMLDVVDDINPYWTIDCKGYLYSNRKVLRDHEKIGVTGDYYADIQKTRIFIDDCREVLEGEGNIVRKIHFVTDNQEMKEELRKKLEQFSFLRITSSHPKNFEITDPHATKGDAIAFIIKREWLKKEDTIAFGDNDNDIEMFKNVGHGYAVEVSTKGLQEVAYQVIGKCEDEALAHFVNDNILQK